MTFLKTRSGDFVGTPPQIRGGGARDQQSIRFKPYSHLWYQSGYPSLIGLCPPLVGVTGFARLWSAALWAPYGLSEFKFYD